MWGGRRLYIPAAPAPDCALVALLGELQASRLAAQFGGDVIDVPLPDLMPLDALKRGASALRISTLARSRERSA
jgi:hypothetical protein